MRSFSTRYKSRVCRAAGDPARLLLSAEMTPWGEHLQTEPASSFQLHQITRAQQENGEVQHEFNLLLWVPSPGRDTNFDQNLKKMKEEKQRWNTSSFWAVCAVMCPTVQRDRRMCGCHIKSTCRAPLGKLRVEVERQWGTEGASRRRVGVRKRKGGYSNLE